MISLITCSVDPNRAIAFKEHIAAVLRDEPFEHLVIENPGSLARGYNEGIDRSKGEVLIFSRDDIEILNTDFVPRLGRHLEHVDLVGVAGTTRMYSGHWLRAGPPYVSGQVAYRVINTYQEGLPQTQDNLWYGVHLYWPRNKPIGTVQGLDGVLLACKRSVVEKVRFDEERFNGFFLYDADFSFSAYQAGFKLGVAGDIGILHESMGTFNETWQQYMNLFQEKHRNRLAPDPQRPFRVGAVYVRTKPEILEVMGVEPS